MRGEGAESNWMRNRRSEFVQLRDRRAFNCLRCGRRESDWLKGGRMKYPRMSVVSFTLYFTYTVSLGPDAGRWKLILPELWGNGDRCLQRKGGGWVTLDKGQKGHLVLYCSFRLLHSN